MNIRHAIYRAEFHARDVAGYAGRFPVHVDVELSGKCQLACTMCPYGTGGFDESKQGMMPRVMVVSALRQARLAGAKSVKLNFRGEPGLSPDLADMITYAKKLDFDEVSINTNLTAFSYRRLNEICEAGIDLVIVSADGASEETYEAIRVNGNFEKLMDRLKALYGHPKRPRVRVQMVVQDRNRHEVDLAKDVFTDYCDEIRFHNVRSNNTGERKRCPQPFQRLVVMWDGQVGACCGNWDNEAVIGRFPEQSLLEIWHSPEAQALRRKAREPNSAEPCRSCLVGGSYK